MIQLIGSTRQHGTATAVPIRQSDGPEVWGSWSGRKHYALEIIQHPLRARMCGFGDKDRRPLAPAAVAKMVVTRDDNTIVDVDDVDCSFFLVTVDLWSEDGKNEMNLVLHPSSSSDRYVPSNAPTAKPRTRKEGKSNTATPRASAGNQTPGSRSTPTPHADPSSTMSFTSFASPTESSAPVWGYSPQSSRNTTYPPPILPSINSFAPSAESSSSTQGSQWTPLESEELGPFKPWSADVNPPFEGGSNAAWSTDVSHFSNEGFSSTGNLGQSSFSQPSGYYPPGTTTHSGGVPIPMPPLPRHTYTRTLVGPLSANATRLLDEHRKPAIFFLFQDLSVRTEGTFRLRLRLMNIGAHPAPESGAMQVHTGTSPVLAQSFTDPFTVYSAKRFPGVPDTTALSIALGNQGQKLPLRNRHGSTSKRRRRGDSSSDDDSG